MIINEEDGYRWSYEDGFCVVHINTEYGVRSISGIGDKFEAKKRGEVYKAVAERFDLAEECKRGTLPVDVVMCGKAAIAAYMYAVHRLAISEVAEIMDVRRDTVEQYLTTARTGFN